MGFAIVGIIGLILGIAVGRFVLSAPSQRKLESSERTKARLEQGYKEFEADNQQLKSQVQQIDTTHQRQIQDLETSYQKQLTELEQTYQSQIQSLQAQAASPASTASDDLISLTQSHQAEVLELASKHRSEIESYQQQIHDLQNAHQTEIDSLQQTHQSQIQELQQAHQTQIHHLESSYQTQIAEIEQSYESQLQARNVSPESPIIAPPVSPSGGLPGIVTGLAGAAAGVAAGIGLTEFFSREEQQEDVSPVSEGITEEAVQEIPDIVEPSGDAELSTPEPDERLPDLDTPFGETESLASDFAIDEGFPESFTASPDLENRFDEGFPESFTASPDLENEEPVFIDLPETTDDLLSDLSFFDTDRGIVPPTIPENEEVAESSEFDVSELESLLSDESLIGDEIAGSGTSFVDPDLEFLELLENDQSTELPLIEDESALELSSSLEFPAIEDEIPHISSEFDTDPFADLFDEEQDSSDLEFLELLQTEEEVSAAAIENTAGSNPFANLFEAGNDSDDLDFGELLSTEDENQNSGFDLSLNGHHEGLDALLDSLSEPESEKVHKSTDFT